MFNVQIECKLYSCDVNLDETKINTFIKRIIKSINERKLKVIIHESGVNIKINFSRNRNRKTKLKIDQDIYPLTCKITKLC